MTAIWVEPDIRNQVVRDIHRLATLTRLPATTLARWLGIAWSKYHAWEKMLGCPGKERRGILSGPWLLPEEPQAIIAYARQHPEAGYGRPRYMMIEESVARVGPSSPYRILSEAGLT